MNPFEVALKEAFKEINLQLKRQVRWKNRWSRHDPTWAIRVRTELPPRERIERWSALVTEMISAGPGNELMDQTRRRRYTYAWCSRTMLLPHEFTTEEKEAVEHTEAWKREFVDGDRWLLAKEVKELLIQVRRRRRLYPGEYITSQVLPKVRDKNLDENVT